MLNPENADAIATAERAAAPSASIDFMSLLSTANKRRLLVGSKQVVHPAGTIALRPRGPSMSYLIEIGLARALWNLPDGRQTTTAIVRPTGLAVATSTRASPPWPFMHHLHEHPVPVVYTTHVAL